MTHKDAKITLCRGYIKLHCTIENQDGTVTDKPSGWIDDENGRLFGAICSCGEQAVGWSKGEAVANLACSQS